MAAGLADRCEVQTSYAIGVCQPLSIMINTFGTHKIPEDDIEKILNSCFDMKPASIVSHLNLKRPIYKKTAGYGHFGRNEPEFSWENTDKAEELRNAAGL